MRTAKEILDILKANEFKKAGAIDYREKALESVKIIMDHKSKDVTRKYLRGMSTALHEDFSKYL